MTRWMSAVNQHNKLIKDSPLNAIKITETIFSNRLFSCKLPPAGQHWDGQKIRATVTIIIFIFQTDYGCDIERGSVCTYHPGCVHCVRAIQAR